MPKKQQRKRHDAYVEAFGEAVREKRKSLGLSQEELGYEAELDRTFISGVERGNNPTLKTMLRIADALDTTPAKLLRDAERQGE